MENKDNLKKPMSDKMTMVEVHLQPGARRNEVVSFRDGVLHVRVKAPPRKGEANKALLGVVAQVLAVPRNYLDLVRGHTSRNKAIAIKGLSAEEMKERLRHTLVGKDSSGR